MKESIEERKVLRIYVLLKNLNKLLLKQWEHSKCLSVKSVSCLCFIDYLPAHIIAAYWVFNQVQPRKKAIMEISCYGPGRGLNTHSDRTYILKDEDHSQNVSRVLLVFVVIIPVSIRKGFGLDLRSGVQEKINQCL